MKTLIQHDNPQLLKDAVTLLKSDFTDLYVLHGYDRNEVSVAWHNLRTSAAGHKLRKELVPSYFPPGAAVSFISDVEEEVQIRTKKKKKVVEHDDGDPNEEGSEAFNNANLAVLKSGNKEQIAKSLIESGLTKASELAKEGGFSVPYAYNMLKKYKPVSL